MSRQDLEQQLRAEPEPSPPPDLGERLERGIPEEFRQGSFLRFPEGWSTMQRIGMAGGLASVAVFVLFLLVQPGTTDRSWAAEVESLAEVAARTGSAHFLLEARLDDQEDVSFVALSAPLRHLEAWVEWPREDRPGRMRVEAPGSIYVFDGEGSAYYRRQYRECTRTEEARPNWDLVWPAAWLEELVAFPEEAEVVTETRDGDRSRLVLRFAGAEVEGRAPVFFDEFDREVELEWESSTRALVRFDRWVDDDGERVLFSRLLTLDHPPFLEDGIFEIELPADVTEIRMPTLASGLEELGPGESARAFFEAAVDGDWDRVERFCPTPSLVDWLRSARPQSFRILGDPYRTGTYAGMYVPYRLELAGGKVRQHGLAIRNDNPAGRWIVDGGL